MLPTSRVPSKEQHGNKIRPDSHPSSPNIRPITADADVSPHLMNMYEAC